MVKIFNIVLLENKIAFENNACGFTYAINYHYFKILLFSCNPLF